LIFSISFRELVGSVVSRPPGMQTVATFILREFDQGSPATGMTMGVIATAVSTVARAGWCRRNLSERRYITGTPSADLQISPDTHVV
jgi:hypothetical protein